MVKELGIPKDKIVELSNLLYKNYGTTMAGLRVRDQHPIPFLNPIFVYFHFFFFIGISLLNPIHLLVL